MDCATGTPRVLVVHDQPLIYEGIAAILRRDGGCEVSGQECLSDGSPPERIEPASDVVVIAFASGAEETVEWARVIECKYPTITTVALTGQPTARLLHRIAHASVCSVLVQGSSAAVLVQAVRAASAHQRYLCPVVAEALMHAVADDE